MRISDWSSDVCSSDLMVPAPLGLPCRKRPPAFRSPPSGRDAVATLVPAASPAGRTGKHGFRSRTDCLTLRPNYLIDSMSVTTPAATVSAHPLRRFLPYLWPEGQRRLKARVIAAIMLVLLAKRSEEHTSELQSLMRNSYAVF